MATADPRSAVIDFLTAPTADVPTAEPADARARGPAVPVARVVRGMPFRAQRDTIEFLKERGEQDRRLFAVRCDDEDGRGWFWLVAAERDERGAWQAHGVAGGSGDVPHRSEPWLNFCGAWGKERLYGGGQIHDAGVALSRVRLTLESGRLLDDDADRGVALFAAVEDSAPERIELFDAAGHLAGSHAP